MKGECFQCGKMGHWARECWQRTGGPSSVRPTGNQSYNGQWGAPAWQPAGGPTQLQGGQVQGMQGATYYAPQQAAQTNPLN